MFKPMFQAGCCRLLAQAVPKPSRGLWADRGGVASAEYALLASLLTLAVLTGGTAVGTALQSAFSVASHSLGQAAAHHAHGPDACRQAAQGDIAPHDRKLGRAQE